MPRVMSLVSASQVLNLEFDESNKLAEKVLIGLVTYAEISKQTLWVSLLLRSKGVGVYLSRKRPILAFLYTNICGGGM